MVGVQSLTQDEKKKVDCWCMRNERDARLYAGTRTHPHRLERDSAKYQFIPVCL